MSGNEDVEYCTNFNLVNSGTGVMVMEFIITGYAWGVNGTSRDNSQM